jgi:hypothetical protein
MMETRVVLGAAFGCMACATAFAMPSNANSAANAAVAVEPIRLVCDEFRRCWRTGPEYNEPLYRRSQSYGYDDGYRLPPTKWEQKGFCPPGQHKKGNC